MMRTIFIRGDRGRMDRVYYAAKVSKMQIGVGVNTKSEQYACIDLFYSGDSLEAMLAITEAMKRDKVFPSVYFSTDEQQRVYVVVIFSIYLSDLELLGKIAPEKYVRVVQQVIEEDDVELISTAEAEFLKHDVQSFLELYEEQGFFHLFIQNEDEPGEPPCWGVNLPVLCEGTPEEFADA